MMRLAATAIAVVLSQASPTLAGGLSKDLVTDRPKVEVVSSTDRDAARNRGPSPTSSEISALQYHETAVEYTESLSFRCQTREGVFDIHPPRPSDTSCVVNALPGFMLP